MFLRQVISDRKCKSLQWCVTVKLPHRLLLVGPLALLSILAAAADPGVYRPVFKDYKDWTLTCDNGKRCYADHYGDGATVPTLLVIPSEDHPDPGG